MNQHSMVACGDVFKAHYGKALKAGDRVEEGPYEVFGSNGKVGQHDETLCESATLIIGRKGSVGHVAYAPKGGWTIDTAFYVELLDKTRCDLKYLFYALKSSRLENKTITTSIPGLNRNDLYQTRIPLPPINEQKRIAAILDKADSIRRKRQKAFELTDQILRSAFFEIFGDPIKNPKNLPIRRLSDFYINEDDGTKCGPFGSALKKHEYRESGIPVWNMDNISPKGEFLSAPNLWIDDEKFKQLSSYSTLSGDVLISRAGTVGKMCVLESEYNHSLISTNLIRLRLNANLSPRYFVNLMTLCKGRVGRLRTGPDGSFTHMNTGILDKLEIPIPSPELQAKFEEVYSRISRHRGINESWLETSTLLTDSVASRFFHQDGNVESGLA